MVTQARGPRVLKGALVFLESSAPAPKVIAFQYNPATLTRSLKPLLVGGEAGDRSEAVRIAGAPTETLSVEIEIDATDDLEKGASVATSLGIQPQLAAMELLIHPKSSYVLAESRQVKEGIIEIAPSLAPRILFVWGERRVLPVKIEGFNITEEEFDASLNPIRATVKLDMRVLTYSDLSPSNPDFNQYLAYQQSLESAAGKAVTMDTTALGGVVIKS